jgi:hypothetical protein
VKPRWSRPSIRSATSGHAPRLLGTILRLVREKTSVAAIKPTRPARISVDVGQAIPRADADFLNTWLNHRSGINEIADNFCCFTRAPKGTDVQGNIAPFQDCRKKTTRHLPLGSDRARSEARPALPDIALVHSIPFRRLAKGISRRPFPALCHRACWRSLFQPKGYPCLPDVLLRIGSAGPGNQTDDR